MTALEGALLAPSHPAGPLAEPSVRPSPGLRSLMWVCLGASIAAQLIPSSAPFILVIYVGMLGGWVAFFAYRWQRRRRQHAINAAAAQYVGENEFVLYLRPFMTSGRLPVHCLLPSVVDRWLMGKFWDLEIALSLAVGSRLVAVGSDRKSLGAGKLSSSEETWQGLVDQLGNKARLVLLVPFNRPGTMGGRRSRSGAAPSCCRKPSS